MNIKSKLRAWLGIVEPTVAPAKPKRRTVRPEVIAAMRGTVPQSVRYEVKPPSLLPGVVPQTAKADPNFMALDDVGMSGLYGYANEAGFSGMGFPGYPYLSELTQRSEYRSASQTLADEMTRRWIKIRAQGDGDLTGKIEIIEAELKRHKVRELFHTAALQDGFFGRAQIYINIKGQNDDEGRKLPLIVDSRTVKKGSLLGFKNVEAIWTTPYAYDSLDPLGKDFFKPTSWFVLGKQTHATRLLTIISRQVPDLLKPAYNFSGQSMSQLMEPYVNAWISTRDNVNRIIQGYSTSGIKTDMSQVLTGGDGEDIDTRADLYNAARNNFGLMLLDNSDATNPEEFFQFNTPLAGLDKLQAQAQEHQAAPSHIPLVKLLGITPTGLNATTEGEMDVWYDYVGAQQANNFTDPLITVINLIQLDQFGEIDPAISFEFEPLKQLDGKALSEVRKSDAEAAATYITAGVISPGEERQRLASDINSGYTSLDVDDLPPPANGDEAGNLDE